MKHILSILTAALALTASTAFAAFDYENFQYHGYTSKDYVDASGTVVPLAAPYSEWSLSSDVESQVVHFDGYDVIRTRFNDNQSVASNQKTYFKIRITGESVDLYVADYCGTLGDTRNENSLRDKGISKYGYHYLDARIDEDPVEKTLTNGEKLQSIPSPENNVHTITRYGYSLGTFSKGDEFEITLRYGENDFVSSYDSQYMNNGEFGDGAPIVDSLAQHQLGYFEAKKSMPLASLDTGNGHRVYFTIYGISNSVEGGAVGSPLPGGLPIALCAGVFALGFWYIRRRKAIAA